MGSATTERTINGLRLILATHGLPEEVVSNKEFTSTEFAEFMRKKRHKSQGGSTISSPV